MAIPENVYRVVIGGNLPGGEIWSTGWWVQGAVPTDNATADATADLWMGECMQESDPALMRLMLASYMTAESSWEYTRVYAYPDGGPHAPFVGESLAHHAGTATSNPMPNQVALVASLRTGSSGRRNRGRMYLPTTALDLNNDGQVGQSDVEAIAGSVAGMFGRWNQSDDNGVVVVVSQTATQAHQITSVICDSRCDIQRRRAASQAILRSDVETVTQS